MWGLDGDIMDTGIINYTCKWPALSTHCPLLINYILYSDNSIFNNNIDINNEVLVQA